MEIKDLGPVKAKPRYLAVSCPRRGIASVSNLVFSPHGISFYITKCQSGFWDQKCTGVAHLQGQVFLQVLSLEIVNALVSVLALLVRAVVTVDKWAGHIPPSIACGCL